MRSARTMSSARAGQHPQRQRDRRARAHLDATADGAAALGNPVRARWQDNTEPAVGSGNGRGDGATVQTLHPYGITADPNRDTIAARVSSGRSYDPALHDTAFPLTASFVALIVSMATLLAS